ncbi:hypothetical protein LMH87_002383 [Akanthomyces muscarius]|uniref:Uncharacterized protein n=1 Tax=Akanthomyces muscarius TaxID=2231603 RepID=A0A9W8Q6Z2_AKAMU|nr:hypothetical protein LMH87_002383 [Akanthomyces muscarius]KAJ4147882.1 hypothetical protein LMH87_002383 [Akanthomyces muscarius]
MLSLPSPVVSTTPPCHLLSILRLQRASRRGKTPHNSPEYTPIPSPPRAPSMHNRKLPCLLCTNLSGTLMQVIGTPFHQLSKSEAIPPRTDHLLQR